MKGQLCSRVKAMGNPHLLVEGHSEDRLTDVPVTANTDAYCWCDYATFLQCCNQGHYPRWHPAGNHGDHHEEDVMVPLLNCCHIKLLLESSAVYQAEAKQGVFKPLHCCKSPL